MTTLVGFWTWVHSTHLNHVLPRGHGTRIRPIRRYSRTPCLLVGTSGILLLIFLCHDILLHVVCLPPAAKITGPHSLDIAAPSWCSCCRKVDEGRIVPSGLCLHAISFWNMLVKQRVGACLCMSNSPWCPLLGPLGLCRFTVSLAIYTPGGRISFSSTAEYRISCTVLSSTWYRKQRQAWVVVTHSCVWWVSLQVEECRQSAY